MKKKLLSYIFASVMLLAAAFGTGLCVYADGPDNSALLAAFDKVSCYEEADYTPESYGALYTLYEQYSGEYETYTTQQETDAATASLLEAISDLRAHLSLTVTTANGDAQISVSYGETSLSTGRHTVVYGAQVTLSASEVQGYSFGGWYETVSKRFLSNSRNYTFTMTAKTSLKAVYYNSSDSTLTFTSSSGQIVSVTEKSSEDWAVYESLESFIPETVPYRFGYTNGRWVLPADALSRLISGESITVTPEYDVAQADSFAPPASIANGVNLKLYYRHDADNSVGSLIMTTAIPQDITPEAVGMILYNKKANEFNPASFDININNKTIASQFNSVNEEKYITNINHLTSKYNWAVKGYATYYVNGKLVTVYSNQVNIVNTEDVHVLSDIPAAQATCTESGNTAGTYCDVCGKYFGVEEIAPLGHDYNSVVTAPACIEQGYTTHVCSRCGDSYIDSYVDSIGHDWGEFSFNWAQDYSSVTAERTCKRDGCHFTATESTDDIYSSVSPATCTENGTVTYTGIFANESMPTPKITVVTENALGHNYNAVVTAPTCTEGGYTTYTCTRCGDSYVDYDTAAAGHNYNAVVTEPTCTESGYTTHTCSRCGDSYTDTETAAIGHSWGSWSVTTGATLSAGGVETRTCANDSSHTDTRNISNFTLKLPNTADYLYRVGNANNVKLGQLFDNASGADITGVTATVTKNYGTATGTFTANSSDWRNSTIKFNNVGIVTVTLKHGNFTAATLKLEVVAATNKANEMLGNVGSGNAVLLGDVYTGSYNSDNELIGSSSVSGTLYGNGFTVDAVSNTLNSSNNTNLGYLGGALNLNSGTINNVKVIGPNFKNAAMFRDNVNNVFTVRTSGTCYIYNCYIFGSRSAIGMYGNSSSCLTVENSVIDGGRYCNIFMRYGALKLHNVTTISQPRTTLNGDTRCGFGIIISDEAGENEQITATGYLKQYNWVGKTKDKNYFKGDNSDSTDADTAISSLFTNMYTKASSLTVSYNGDTFINTGILSLSSNAPRATGEALNAYGYSSVSLSNYNGWVMAPTSLNASEDFAYYSETQYAPSSQTPTVPSFTWSYPSTYNSTEKKVNLSYEQGSSVSFNPNILTSSKWGNSLNVTVSMDGNEYTGNNITFNTAGTYTIEYTITDPYNYAADGVTASDYVYKKYLTVSVTKTVSSISAPVFTFYDTSGSSLGSKTVDIGTKHYVMPDVTATSDYVMSSTVSGTTVYAPVVTVQFKDNSSDFNYLLPIFTGVNIRNYTNESGAYTDYTKSTNISALPSGLEKVTSDPMWNGKTTFNTYERNSTYGLYAKSDAIGSNQSARNATIEFKFTAGNGEAYYYRIYFNAAAHNKPCVAEGSLVTMADGTQKAIEDVKQGDMVMTWSMWNGCYEAQPVAIHWYHGTEERDVLTLNFTGGTSVRVINEHGFFDVDKNTYVYITPNNVDEYVGDRFIRQSADGSNTNVVLENYGITTEYVGSYSLQTVRNDNFIVENMLSMTAEDFAGRFEYFEVGEGLKYDEAKMESDIENYGLYTYDYWSDYLSEEEFYALNGPYFKVLVGRGVLTEDDILRQIEYMRESTN